MTEHIFYLTRHLPLLKKNPRILRQILRKKKKIKIKINHSTIDTLNTITISNIYISLNNIKFTKEKKKVKKKK